MQIVLPENVNRESNFSLTASLDFGNDIFHFRSQLGIFVNHFADDRLGDVSNRYSFKKNTKYFTLQLDKEICEKSLLTVQTEMTFHDFILHFECVLVFKWVGAFSDDVMKDAA